MPCKSWCLTFVLMLSMATMVAAASLTLTPSKDSTLIQVTSNAPASQLSNGAGDIFVGRTAQDGSGMTTPTISIRRGLVAFDVAAHPLPAGATITSVTLTVRDIMGLNGDPVIELHDALQDWGQGISFQNGGAGAASQNHDATWFYSDYNLANPAASTQWITPGGNFSSTVSSSTVIADDNGPLQMFSWTSVGHSQMLADVQSWYSNPATNFGWLLKQDSEAIGQTAKRLNSSESPSFSSPGVAPVLTINYTLAPEPSGLVLGAVAALCAALAGVVRRRRA